MPATTRPTIGRTVDESIEGDIAAAPSAPPGSPNVLFILLDDVGFAQYGCFGSSILTPNIDRIANEGLRYTNFHTTALCSPTRAALLTGRNCHSVGFGHVVRAISGFPGLSMHLPDSAGTIAEILRMNGYSTRAVGKWHLTPSHETGPQGPFDRWPLGRGFQRFYGFLGGTTDQYRPYLHRDNSPVPVPGGGGTEYHLTTDLVDESIRQIGDLQAMAPDRPFYLHFAPAVGHSPHQVPAEWVEQYRGAFDHGWDEERERVLTRQIELGVMPEGTTLSPSNPGVREWASLPDSEKMLYARMQEVYAGFLSHADAQIGRLLDYLEQIGVLDDTIVMLCSDNGASGEGGPEGSVDDGLYSNVRPQTAEDGLAHLDELGGPRLQNHYPWGWAQAGNTPFRWYKQFTHAGGITNGLIVRWPGGDVPVGEIRTQYHHVIDVAPTLLELLGIEMPEQIGGVSMAYTFAQPDAPTRRRTQYYEMWGNRGLWRDGFMAVSRLQPDGPAAYPPAPIQPFDEVGWELYDHRTDPSESHDLAAEDPQRVSAMEQLWWAEAGRYDVLPVDTRHRSKRQSARIVRPAGARATAVFFGAGGPYESGVAPTVTGRSFTISADAELGERASGVIYMFGSRHGGYCLYLDEGRPTFEVAVSSIESQSIVCDQALPAGRHLIEVRVTAGADLRGTVALFVNGTAAGTADVPLLRVMRARTYIGYTETPTVSESFAPPFRLEGTLIRLEVAPAPTAGSAP